MKGNSLFLCYLFLSFRTEDSAYNTDGLFSRSVFSKRKLIIPLHNTQKESFEYDQGLVNFGTNEFENIKSPFMWVANSVVQILAPIIASLKIPNIQPVLDLIILGYVTISNRIAIVMSTAISNIEKVLNTYGTDMKAKVESIIKSGNAEIASSIASIFRLAINNINASIDGITANENKLTRNNLISEEVALVKKITDRLLIVENAIDGIINPTPPAVISEIENALTTQNQKVYTQIIDLLANEKNVEPIIKQLIYADAEAIAGLLKNDSNNNFAEIKALMDQAQADINIYITEGTIHVVDTQKTILNNGNEIIIRNMNDILNPSLVAIKNKIDTVTLNEIDLINKALSANGSTSSDLATTIKGIIREIPKDVNIIVRDVTESQIPLLEALITANNNEVKLQVDRALG